MSLQILYKNDFFCLTGWQELGNRKKSEEDVSVDSLQLARLVVMAPLMVVNKVCHRAPIHLQGSLTIIKLLSKFFQFLFSSAPF